MSKTDDQIAELRIELADQRAQIADLRAQIASHTAPAPAHELQIPPTRAPTKPETFVERGASVVYAPTANACLVMPNPGELAQLQAIVTTCVPEFAPQPDRYGNVNDAEFAHEFETAIWAVGSCLTRTDLVNHQRGVGYWRDFINDELRKTSRRSVGASAFCSAVLALNTPHCVGAKLATAAFGLAVGSGGKVFVDEWRAVLSAGRIRARLVGRLFGRDQPGLRELVQGMLFIPPGYVALREGDIRLLPVRQASRSIWMATLYVLPSAFTRSSWSRHTSGKMVKFDRLDLPCCRGANSALLIDQRLYSGGS